MRKKHIAKDVQNSPIFRNFHKCAHGPKLDSFLIPVNPFQRKNSKSQKALSFLCLFLCKNCIFEVFLCFYSRTQYNTVKKAVLGFWKTHRDRNVYVLVDYLPWPVPRCNPQD